MLRISDLPKILVLVFASASAQAQADDAVKIQDDIWTIGLMAERAKQIQSLCGTGFGPPQLCQKATDKSERPVAAEPSAPAKSPPVAAVSIPLPTLIEIAGAGGIFRAVLAYADGGTETVTTGARTRDGYRVAAITLNDLRLALSTGETVLHFPGARR